MTFQDVCSFICHIPYGRNTDRSDFSLILKEGVGTCSTKHAFLAQLAVENSISEIQLYIGIYRMSELNTKGVGTVLKHYQLAYLPEAHTYLKIGEDIFDFTSPSSKYLKFKTSLEHEEPILPHQIGNYKIELHKNYLRDWILRDKIPFSFQEIWAIREACIARLSQ